MEFVSISTLLRQDKLNSVMNKFFVLIVCSFIYSTLVQAQVKVAFIKVYDKSFVPLKLERNSHFFHLAISYQDGWVHAHNFRGVEKIKHFKEMGFEHFTVTTLTAVQHPNLDHEITKYIGKKFDRHFSWGGEELYCSELIARIFSIEPTPMSFDGEQWERMLSSRGQLGISPDEVYEALSEQGFQIDRNCSTFL
ncbi:MAG: hypothetical protein JNM93_09535 [Bacteriovoracaceae bacterium]|nr:hypothetical protein [Bacteriovoracaceae bacterium]